MSSGVFPMVQSGVPRGADSGVVPSGPSAPGACVCSRYRTASASPAAQASCSVTRGSRPSPRRGVALTATLFDSAPVFELIQRQTRAIEPDLRRSLREVVRPDRSQRYRRSRNRQAEMRCSHGAAGRTAHAPSKRARSACRHVEDESAA